MTSRNVRGSFALISGLFVAFSLHAQVPVREIRVQIASGFSPVEGRLITAGDTVIFMDDAQPQSSFYATRAMIDQVVPGQADTVTMHFKKPVRDREGERMRVEFRLSAEDRDALRAWFNQSSPASAGGPSGGQGSAQGWKSYPARRDKFIGGDNGQLIVKQDRLAFEAGDAGASREWLFSDIKRFRQNGPYRLEIEPFAGDKYTLELQGGGGMAAEDFKKIADEIARARSTRR